MTLAVGLPKGLSAEQGPTTPKPWLVQGTVTDVDGKPIAGAEVTASCGMGTLFVTGKAVSDAKGRYELRFGPGVLSKTLDLVQAATIAVHKPGFFERNLHRQGDLLAAYKLPQGEIGWGKKKPEDVVLPDRPKEVNFVLLPAATLVVQLQDAKGEPMANSLVGLTGKELPPSSSVLGEKKTDAQGRVRFEDVPTGYEFKIYVDDKRPNWREWSSAMINLKKPVHYEVLGTLANGTLQLEWHE